MLLNKKEEKEEKKYDTNIIISAFLMIFLLSGVIKHRLQQHSLPHNTMRYLCVSEQCFR